MKPAKFIFCIWIITAFALLYVWQQVELVRVSYEIREAKCEVAHLLDQNRYLRYNVASLSSPSRLAKEKSVRNLELEPPKSLELVRLIEVTPAKTQLNISGPRGRRSIFSFFTLESPQAEANQIK